MGANTTRRWFLAAALNAAAATRNIRVGCQANGWTLREGDFDQLLGVLGEMRKIGYTGFECNIRFVKGQFANAAAARRRIEETGVRFIGAHTSLDQSETDEFAARAAGVAALGGERIVMSARAVEPDRARRLEAAARVARASGVRIAYHNHNPEFADHNAIVEELARGTDPGLVDFLVDAGHGYLGGGDPAEFASRHAKRIFGFHLKTFRGPKDQTPLGEGDFGFEALAAALRKARWSGWLIAEEGGGPTAGNTAAVRPDRDYIRRVFGA